MRIDINILTVVDHLRPKNKLRLAEKKKEQESGILIL